MTRASVCNWGLSSQQSNKVCSSTNCRYEFKKTLRIVLFNLTPEIRTEKKLLGIMRFSEHLKIAAFQVFLGKSALNSQIQLVYEESTGRFEKMTACFITNKPSFEQF